MKEYSIIIILLAMLNNSCNTSGETEPTQSAIGKTAIVIHGGAGNLKKLNLTPDEELQYKSALQASLKAGNDILQAGGTALDAVEAAIHVMEDSPLFNAGKGAVFNHEGINEMDAAIMNGSDLSCGAVAGVRHIRNPITAARKVMENSEFILLSGKGAEEFAQKNGVGLVDSSYFFTDFRWQQLQDAIIEDSVKLDHTEKKSASLWDKLSGEEKFGTVGCVALDKQGNIAAGTSTGGLTNKRYGRIGDSPLIGAGTYADNLTCAVSCTGKGEDFIRLNVAHDISSIIRYRAIPLDSAVNEVIKIKLKSIKGRGGCIALNKEGQIAMAFTTTGMYRGYIDTNGKMETFIYEN